MLDQRQEKSQRERKELRIRNGTVSFDDLYPREKTRISHLPKKMEHASGVRDLPGKSLRRANLILLRVSFKKLSGSSFPR